MCFVSQYVIIFSLVLQMININAAYSLVLEELNMLGAVLAMCILVTLLCSVMLGGLFPSTLLFPMLMKAAYPPVYFAYQSAACIVLACLHTRPFSLYIVGGLALLFLLFVLAYQPYPRKLHNFVLALNQFYVLAAVAMFVF